MSQDGSHAFDGVVALDGPSGTGKSSAARLLARRLGSRYLDTGAMYRAATVAALHAGVDLTNPEAIARTVAAADIVISTDPEPAVVRLDGVDVSQEIRSAAVTQAVSAIAAVPAVRTLLVAQQRELIGTGGIVVEGRDIGSTVWPEAVPKVYLTASPHARASGGPGKPASTRTRSRRACTGATTSTARGRPALRRADEAIEIDTTELTLEEVVQGLGRARGSTGMRSPHETAPQSSPPLSQAWPTLPVTNAGNARSRGPVEGRQMSGPRLAERVGGLAAATRRPAVRGAGLPRTGPTRDRRP